MKSVPRALPKFSCLVGIALVQAGDFYQPSQLPKGLPPEIWGTSRSVVRLPSVPKVRAPPPRTPSPQSHSPQSPFPSGPCLSALALVDEEDTGKGIREPTAISSKEASGLIHVGSQLEDLLLCGKEWAEPCHTATVALWGYKLGEWPTQDEESSLTGVDQADWRKGVQTQALGCFDLLEATWQATQEVLPLLTEAQPQVELQLGLDCPTC